PDLISPKKYIAPLLGTWKESVGAWYYSQVVLGYDPIDKTPIDSIETRKTAYNELVKLFLGFDPISLNKVDHPVQIEEFRKSINNKTHGIGFFNTFLANKELPRQYIDFFKHDYLPLVSHIPSKYIHHPDITNHLSKTYSNLTGGGTSFGDT
ncbi:MAG: hypothetical protein KKF44_05395, partial [Nanoarchaeota archaeon]|nr:hypothetical protein [Nanoarchaeota archaeon]